MLQPRRMLSFVLVFALALTVALADPYVTVVDPPTAFVDDPTCELVLEPFGAEVPDAAVVPIVVYPDAIFAGATHPMQGNANGVDYEMLPSVRMLTYDPVAEVAEFYAGVLGEGWSFGDVYGTQLFYFHEPVDEPLMLMLDKPGAIPSVEIGEVFFDCDQKLDPAAVSYVSIYYAPR